MPKLYNLTKKILFIIELQNNAFWENPLQVYAFEKITCK